MPLYKEKSKKLFSFALLFKKKYMKLLIFRLYKFLSKKKKFFKFRARKFHFLKYKNFFQSVFFFHFLSSESYFLKYKRNIRLESSISRNIRKIRWARILNIRFLKYEKSSFMPGLWIYLSWSIRKVPFPENQKSFFENV